ncbi:MAG: DsbA family protein [Pseudomonadota bacterium]
MRAVIAICAVAAVVVPVAVATGILITASDPREPSAPVADAPSNQTSEPPIALLDEPSALASLAAADPQAAMALVRNALLADPSILEEAINALEAFRFAEAEARSSELIAESAEALLSTQHASVLGNPDGTVTLVEFLDYNCGFCKRAHADVLALIESEPNLRVLVKDFPVLGPGSLEAARVAIAFRQSGGDMLAFIDTMMAQTDRRADATLATEVALSLGADQGELETLATDDAILEGISASYGLAELLGITGTPAFVVGNELIMGAVGFERLAMAIQTAQASLGTEPLIEDGSN